MTLSTANCGKWEVHGNSQQNSIYRCILKGESSVLLRLMVMTMLKKHVKLANKTYFALIRLESPCPPSPPPPRCRILGHECLVVVLSLLLLGALMQSRGLDAKTALAAARSLYVYDDVTYVYDDVTYVYDDAHSSMHKLRSLPPGPYFYVLLPCMCSMYALYARLTCVPHMYALYACLVYVCLI
jgi:hypothetical protein